MKKPWVSLSAALLLLLTTVGCSTARAEQELSAAGDAIRSAVSAAPAATPSLPGAVDPEAPAMLTKEEAEKTALDYAGFTAGQVTGLSSEREIDDGITQYDVRFYANGQEYEFEIHANTGQILSFDKDKMD